jgi:hypothetical protein
MDKEEVGGLQRHPAKMGKETEDASRHVFKAPEPKKSLLGMLICDLNCNKIVSNAWE